ncbi:MULTISPECIES: UPF0175 family protein [Cyanophyceae]|uniref:Uncharacterized protein n=1 Tax=Nodularia spumigena CENA596 TaxID=1819295 RepID=A0A166JMW1_NODSP|nr:MULTISPECIES: UPF0175 family protein [Cyanophyceae]MDB9355093.1 UPF0175 family protein [Nodularia spumigena CS-587/03]KZL49908.1 hypothetical protein A2T98_10330 [Nodularia spumigena CENA596]MCC2692849.1 UPF0175 family protein [Nodularia sp. LEGE 04288]MDB9317591.1 UPF0175 family protein [Nodularia spumigena CS-590/01A]MDB9322824.1 UPF0175 family protein [Nodularia spumigena CS-591/07A]
MNSINLQLSSDLIQAGEEAIRQELAVQLYDQNVFSFGQARHLANLSVWEFQQLLGQRQIKRHYNEIDLLEDVKTIQEGF